MDSTSLSGQAPNVAVTPKDPARTAVAAFGFTDADITPFEAHGSGNVWLVATEDGTSLVLKDLGAGADLDAVVAQTAVSVHLAAAGVPVATPVPAPDGSPLVYSGARAFVLTRRLAVRDDRPPPFSAAYWTEVGVEVARLHLALLTCAVDVASWTMDLPLRIGAEVLPELDRAVAAGRLEPVDAGASDRSWLRQRLAGLPAQRIHGDLHGGNLLLDGSGVYGVVDFDHLPIGPRVYDLGYLAADIVKNGMREHDDLTTRLPWIAGLVRGYHAASPLTSEERAAIGAHMLATELLMVGVFVDGGASDHLDLNARTCRWISSHRSEIEAVVAETDDSSAS